ncbi:HAD family hydrolase [Pedobacter xixiisoli]|uniref:Putative hydrolase of the HAD superfamily n=1 Tax=Pedobacter xixiisoli TaxID=1476464 RepID=A0A285ZSM0_9SPHI|nr:HAD family hydrolase [Pedobacter xixiisoli]SOD12660.1 putative hydrolase of the HAD superfamily [Pedobacter xixiisoli]
MFNEQLLQDFSKYRHISFDLWLTLIRSNPEYKPKRNQLFRDFFAIDKPIEEVAAVIRKFDILTNGINEKVNRNFDTYEIYCLILDALEVKLESYQRQQLEDFYKHTEELMMQYKPLLLDDNLPKFLKQLHDDGKTMNILSNTAFIKGSSLRHIIAHYQLDSYFAFQAFSDETGFSKPGLAMYEYAYQNIKLLAPIEKHEVLHVGDNVVSDYNGALAYGFDAYLITHKTTDESKLQPL